MRLKQLFVVVATLLFAANASAAKKMTTVYMYGFATSFNDSTVYFTEIQQIDSAYVDSKTKFLYSRENYSYQLQDYLESIGFSYPTCITSFALSRKDAEKKYLNLRQKYLKEGNYTIKMLKQTDFQYRAIPYIPEEN